VSPLNKPSTRNSDLLWGITRKITPLCLLLPLLGTGLSYIAYANDVAQSNLPWWIGTIVTVLCVSLPFAISSRYRRSNLLKAYGLIVMVGLAATYFFFGVFGYFFYFGFAPMPSLVRLAGLGGGVALSVYWAGISVRAVRHTLSAGNFVKNSFSETESNFVYKLQASMARFEKLHKERSPFPRVIYWLVMGVSPLALILNRVLSPAFGGNGVLFIIAVFAMPMSLWIIGLLVRLYLLMVELPNTLERQSGKSVMAVE
jgi:hypothetical protein